MVQLGSAVGASCAMGIKHELAKRMRGEPTSSEAIAWSILRRNGCFGLRFRRQHVIGGFIVDFYCGSLRLAIEIDGEVHDDPQAAVSDEERTAALAARGVVVARIRNSDLSAGALEALIRPYIEKTGTRPPSPSYGEGVRGRGSGAGAIGGMKSEQVPTEEAPRRRGSIPATRPDLDEPSMPPRPDSGTFPP